MKPNAKAVLALALIGAGILMLLVIMSPGKPVAATQSTPTPTALNLTNSSDTPSDMLCHLAADKHCGFINPIDIAVSNTVSRINPAIGASNVPTYTLVSVISDNDVDVTNLNTDTLYLSQGPKRLNGAVRYIEAGKMIVFYPEKPLLPNTTYTATMTTQTENLTDNPLIETRIWTFTTVSALGADLTSADVAALGGMSIYFGDLHGHTGYSDGQGVPADAFTMARASGLHFFGLTEHAFMLNSSEWQDILAQVDAVTIEGQFVALPGFEYSHDTKGHIGVFGSDTYVHRDDPDYDTFDELYNWLANHPTAIGQFNHPGDAGNNNFNNFAYDDAADHKIVLQELTTADQFFLSLNSGWHLGTLKNRDTHIANWGCCPLMGTVAPRLTRAAILEALAAKRTFFVSPSDSNLALTLKANGYWMGSAIPNTNSIHFTVTAHDPNPTGKPLRVFLYDNGVRVAGTTLPATTLYHWTPTIAGELGHYYYAEAYHNGWLYPAYTSPIWVERSPVARAGAGQIVAPGAPVVLNGIQSWDPDGNRLSYRWTQEDGITVALDHANTAQPTFLAPNNLGNLAFHLTVVDTGSLSDFDTTTVTVTDKPILAITKKGPLTVEPGEPINYTLTVTNRGISNATNVIITDTVPTGATYISGGTLMPGNMVSWTVPALPANGGSAQVSFMVAAAGGVVNNSYGASCASCIPAAGKSAVATNLNEFFLPIITKND